MAEESLVIVPTYNERENIMALIEGVLTCLPGAHILVVDDASPDGTGQEVETLARSCGLVQVIRRPGKQGLGSAYLAGFRHGLARPYQFFFQMDADFSHDPKYLSKLLERARADADLVLGSRYVHGGGTKNWGLLRKLVSQGGNLYARSILGLKIYDLTTGFKCFRRRVLEALDLETISSDGYSFQIEMTYRTIKNDFVVEEVPIMFSNRSAGQSKMSWAIFFEAIWVVWRLRLSSSGKK
jgi:dolichol-phosphate mannosyltransferase